jgi:xanthine dehydrogenase molybdopterin-binding subunit B
MHALSLTSRNTSWYVDLSAFAGVLEVKKLCGGVGGKGHSYIARLPFCIRIVTLVVTMQSDGKAGDLQDVSKHQKLVARVLGIPQHKLVSKAKRLGGGFGGKETRGAFLHCATAIAAYWTRQPVRLVLDRQKDMQMTGHRHAFLGRYRAAAAADGRVLALDLELFSNAGAAFRNRALLQY